MCGNKPKTTLGKNPAGGGNVRVSAGEISIELNVRRPSWEAVYYAYPKRYDESFFGNLRYLMENKSFRTFFNRIRPEEQDIPTDKFSLSIGYKTPFTDEEVSAIRVSIALSALSKKMRKSIDTEVESLKEDVVEINKGKLTGRKCIKSVGKLIDWLSKREVWGEPREVDATKGLDDVRKKISGQKGICIISKPGGDTKNGYATLWVGDYFVGGHKYIDNGCKVLFWELKSAEFCMFCSNKVVNGKKVCGHHNANAKSIGFGWPKIIGEIAYDSFYKAVMVAANIIFYHISIDKTVEYGTAIYKSTSGKFYLTSLRKGETTNVTIDCGIGNDIYSFVAGVHSHPLFFDGKDAEEYAREFSTGDYYISCRTHGGVNPWPIYLVTELDKNRVLLEFTPPPKDIEGGNILSTMVQESNRATEDKIWLNENINKKSVQDLEASKINFGKRQKNYETRIKKIKEIIIGMQLLKQTNFVEADELSDINVKWGVVGRMFLEDKTVQPNPVEVEKYRKMKMSTDVEGP